MDSIPHTNIPFDFDPYHPASVTLKNGKVYPCVEFCGIALIEKRGGVVAKEKLIQIEDVEDVSQSLYQLPSRCASLLYELGHTGMGYTDFVVIMKDGNKFNFVLRGAPDFIIYPKGYSIDDVVNIDWGGVRTERRGSGLILDTPVSSICLYEEPNETRIRVMKEKPSGEIVIG